MQNVVDDVSLRHMTEKCASFKPCSSPYQLASVSKYEAFWHRADPILIAKVWTRPRVPCDIPVARKQFRPDALLTPPVTDLIWMTVGLEHRFTG